MEGTANALAGLRDGEGVYEVLAAVKQARLDAGQAAPSIILVTDIGKDFDDLAALVVLSELHRLGLVRLLGAVANLVPAQKRAALLRGALDELGLSEVPVGVGSAASNEEHVEFPYEFECSFMSSKAQEDYEDGQGLLERLCRTLVDSEEAKAHLLLLSSLRDAATFAAKEPHLLLNAVGHVHLQGGYSLLDGGSLTPDAATANNHFDLPSAVAFHSFLHRSKLPSTAYTSLAAFACPLPPTAFEELAATGAAIGGHLNRVQRQQAVAFYEGASNVDPAKRFRPDFDGAFFLRTRTNFFQVSAPGQPFPRGDEVLAFVDKLVLYDAIAAVGAAGLDVAQALGIGPPVHVEESGTHSVVGLSKIEPGVDAEKLSTALQALMKGALLSHKQR